MEGTLRVTPGTLLAAWPDLRDPNFMHGVVLICHHNDEGAFGLLVNRETELTTADLVPEHQDFARASFPVHLGGPVDHTTVHFMHTVPDEVPGGTCLDGRLWIGGELDALAAYLVREGEAASERVRVFLGYSGWGAGQLDSELQIGSWLPAVSSAETVFCDAGEPTWRRVVRDAGGDEARLHDLPPDVRWN